MSSNAKRKNAVDLLPGKKKRSKKNRNSSTSVEAGNRVRVKANLQGQSKSNQRDDDYLNLSPDDLEARQEALQNVLDMWSKTKNVMELRTAIGDMQERRKKAKKERALKSENAQRMREESSKLNLPSEGGAYAGDPNKTKPLVGNDLYVDDGAWEFVREAYVDELEKGNNDDDLKGNNDDDLKLLKEGIMLRKQLRKSLKKQWDAFGGNTNFQEYRALMNTLQTSGTQWPSTWSQVLDMKGAKDQIGAQTMATIEQNATVLAQEVDAGNVVALWDTHDHREPIVLADEIIQKSDDNKPGVLLLEIPNALNWSDDLSNDLLLWNGIGLPNTPYAPLWARAKEKGWQVVFTDGVKLIGSSQFDKAVLSASGVPYGDYKKEDVKDRVHARQNYIARNCLDAIHDADGRALVLYGKNHFLGESTTSLTTMFTGTPRNKYKNNDYSGSTNKSIKVMKDASGLSGYHAEVIDSNALKQTPEYKKR